MYTHTLKPLVLLVAGKQIAILPGTVLQVYHSGTGIAWCKTLNNTDLGKLIIGEQVRMPDTGKAYIESWAKLYHS